MQPYPSLCEDISLTLWFHPFCRITKPTMWKFEDFVYETIKFDSLMKSSALLPSNLPSVIDRSNLSPSREAGEWNKSLNFMITLSVEQTVLLTIWSCSSKICFVCLKAALWDHWITDSFMFSFPLELYWQDLVSHLHITIIIIIIMIPVVMFQNHYCLIHVY